MESAIQPFKDFIVARQTRLRFKKVTARFSNVKWIGMKRLILNLVMAILTGNLTMGRNMKLLCVNEPGPLTPAGESH